MATLTYDPTPADQPEFNEAEQEALAIGEAAAAEQEQLLAGKFKDAEALEKAYLELQSKLGSRNEESSEEGDSSDDDQTEEEVEVTATSKILDSLWEDAQNGKITDATREKLAELDTGELAAEYLKYRQAVEQQAYDITDSQVAELRNIAGGEEGYQELVAWASDNLSKEDIQRYDNVIASGNYDAISFAIQALTSKYTEAMGIEGQLLKGKPTASSKDVFRSQAEVVAAMSDPRYDRDPAYRSDVFAKLERSNLEY